MQWQRTDERWKTKEIYWSQNYRGIKRVSKSLLVFSMSKIQAKKCLTSNSNSNEKLSLKLAVSKF